jgi:ABC-type lipoprotein release transport system permease subunit
MKHNHFNLIWTIASRNIIRHRGKSLVIGMILFLGSFIMTLGDGVISGMERGLRINFIDGFMGDIAVISNKSESDNVLFRMMGKPIETIGNYKKIKEVLKTQKYIFGYVPVGKNAAMVLNEEDGEPGYSFLLGVNFDEYSRLFKRNYKVIEGRLLKDGEKGILLPTDPRKQFFDYTNIWFIPKGEKLNVKNLPEDVKNPENIILKNSVVFLGNNEDESATDVRLDVVGVIQYNSLNHIFGHFIILDIESYRECMGYFSASSKTQEVPEAEKKLLSMDTDNMDSLFSSQALSSNAGIEKKEIKQTVSTENNKKVDIEDGAYNIVFVKLNNSSYAGKAIKKLNNIFKNKNIPVHAVAWNKAAGPIGSMALIIKAALFLFVSFLFFVAVVIIMNTLAMAAIERVSEIGMMRAIGASKQFIRWMFISEIGVLALIFGGFGIILGILGVKIIPMFNITTTNDMLQLVYGGISFHPVLNAFDIFLSVIQLIFVTVVSAIYPVKIANDITPLDAVTKD